MIKCESIKGGATQGGNAPQSNKISVHIVAIMDCPKKKDERDVRVWCLSRSVHRSGGAHWAMVEGAILSFHSAGFPGCPGRWICLLQAFLVLFYLKMAI